jgi:hypothetical protein
MALESVDLLALLKRARKPAGEYDAPHEEAEGELHPPLAAPAAMAPTVMSREAMQSAVAVATPTAAEISAAAQRNGTEESVDIDDLRDELSADEVLLQRILGLLYRKKKSNPNAGYISILDMERILGLEREGASFVMSYMKTQKVIEMDDKSRMAITVPGINYLRAVLGVTATSIPREVE